MLVFCLTRSLGIIVYVLYALPQFVHPFFTLTSRRARLTSVQWNTPEGSRTPTHPPTHPHTHDIVMSRNNHKSWKIPFVAHTMAVGFFLARLVMLSLSLSLSLSKKKKKGKKEKKKKSWFHTVYTPREDELSSRQRVWNQLKALTHTDRSGRGNTSKAL